MLKRKIGDDRYLVFWNDKYYVINDLTFKLLDMFDSQNDLKVIEKEVGYNKRELKILYNEIEKKMMSKDYYEKDEDIRRAVDFIVSDELKRIGNEEYLERLHHELISKDWFMTLLDWRDYMEMKERMFADYEKRSEWAKKMLINISQAGFFSSDRTIAQYNEDIWKL